MFVVLLTICEFAAAMCDTSVANWMQGARRPVALAQCVRGRWSVAANKQKLWNAVDHIIVRTKVYNFVRVMTFWRDCWSWSEVRLSAKITRNNIDTAHFVTVVLQHNMATVSSKWRWNSRILRRTHRTVSKLPRSRSRVPRLWFSWGRPWLVLVVSCPAYMCLMHVVVPAGYWMTPTPFSVDRPAVSCVCATTNQLPSKVSKVSVLFFGMDSVMLFTLLCTSET